MSTTYVYQCVCIGPKGCTYVYKIDEGDRGKLNVNSPPQMKVRKERNLTWTLACRRDGNARTDKLICSSNNPGLGHVMPPTD